MDIVVDHWAPSLTINYVIVVVILSIHGAPSLAIKYVSSILSYHIDGRPGRTKDGYIENESGGIDYDDMYIYV